MILKYLYYREHAQDASWDGETPLCTPLIPAETSHSHTPDTNGRDVMNHFNFPTLSTTTANTRLSPMSPITFNYNTLPSPTGATAMSCEVFPDDDFMGAPAKMMEALGLIYPSEEDTLFDIRTPDNDAVVGWNAPPPTTFNAPPPYVSNRMLSIGTHQSLKVSFF